MNSTSRGLFLVGGILAAVSGLCGALYATSVIFADPSGGADIGAAALALVSMPLAISAAAILVAGEIARRRRRRLSAR